MKTAIFAYSRRGCALAQKLDIAGDCRRFTTERLLSDGFEAIKSPCFEFYGELFQNCDALIFIGACGIAVRSIAPHVKSKTSDPAVICMDESGSFVIPLLSGHIGGANRLATELAKEIGAVAVISTATDINMRFSVDTWAAENGFIIDDMRLAKEVSAAILERDIPIFTELEVSGPLPQGIYYAGSGELGIYVGWEKKQPFNKTLRIIPSILHLGIGCRRGTTAEAIGAAVGYALEINGIDSRAICSVASVDIKSDEAGLLEFCREAGLPLHFYSANELQKLCGSFSGSEFVRSVTGVDNVCERAALMDADELIIKKTVLDGVTVAVAAKKGALSFG